MKEKLKDMVTELRITENIIILILVVCGVCVFFDMFFIDEEENEHLIELPTDVRGMWLLCLDGNMWSYKTSYADAPELVQLQPTVKCIGGPNISIAPEPSN